MTENNRPALLRKFLLVSLLIFLIITIAGILMTRTYDHRMSRVKAVCGLNHCIHAAQKRMGVVAQGRLIFKVGVVGGGVAGLALIISFASVKRSERRF